MADQASDPSRTGAGPRSDEARLKDLMGSLRDHWALAISIPALLLVATGLFLVLVTPIYQQSTSIRIEEKKPSVPLLDIAILPQLTGGTGLETEMEVLRSRVIAEQVVDSFGLQVAVDRPRGVLRGDIVRRIEVDRDTPAGEYTLDRQSDGRYRVEVKYRPEDAEGLLSLLRPVVESVGTFGPDERIPLRGGALWLAPAAAEHDEIVIVVDKYYDAVEDLQEEVAVSRPSREAALVVVTYEGPDPVLVRDVTNALAHTFIERRDRVTKADARSTVTFLEDQIQALSLQLAQAEDALRAFRQEFRVISPEAEAEAQIERLATMQAERDAIAAESRALGQLLTEIEAERPTEAGDSSAYRQLIAFPTLFRNPAASELLAQLATVENERATLLSRRTMEDPEVAVLTDRVGEIEGQLRSLAATYLRGLREQVQSLNATLSGYGDELASIPDREIEYVRLMRQATVLGDIYLTLQERLKEAELSVALEDATVRVVDPAILPDEPVKPNVPVSLAMALLIGTLLGITAAVGRDITDTTIRTRAELEGVIGLRVLGSIPRGPEAEAARAGVPRLVTGGESHGPVVEAYRALRTNITFGLRETRPRTLVFTSAMGLEGKSGTVGNLAVTLAQQQASLLLVDADMRGGSLHGLFGAQAEPGLSDVLRGRSPHEEAVQRIPGEAGAGFDLLARGSIPPDPAELLGSTGLGELLEEWTSRYDMILLDAPPLTRFTDAAIVGTQVDGVVLVARAGVTDRGALRLALEQLRDVRAPVLGAVLNDLDRRRERLAGSHRDPSSTSRDG